MGDHVNDLTVGAPGVNRRPAGVRGGDLLDPVGGKGTYGKTQRDRDRVLCGQRGRKLDRGGLPTPPNTLNDHLGAEIRLPPSPLPHQPGVGGAGGGSTEGFDPPKRKKASGSPVWCGPTRLPIPGNPRRWAASTGMAV